MPELPLAAVAPSSSISTATVDVGALEDLAIGRFQIRTVLAAGMGFFTDAYDLFVIGTVLTLLKGVWHLSVTQVSLVSSTALLAAFFGAFISGRVADIIGRRKVFVLVAVTMIIGALASAFAPSLWFLVGARFILGLGIGGDYPVSAVLTSEFSHRFNRGRMVGMVFSMQALGLIVGPLVGLTLIASGMNHDLAWRFMLGIGAIPAIAVLFLRMRMPESARFATQVQGVKTAEGLGLGLDIDNSVVGLDGAAGVGGETTSAPGVSTNSATGFGSANGHRSAEVPSTTEVSDNGLAPRISFREFISNRRWQLTLLGTAGTWFLFDYAYYGNSISTPLILNDVAPHSTLVKQLAWTVGIFVVAAVPGYILAFMTMDRIGHRRLQVIGFSMMAASFLLLGAIPKLTSVVSAFLAIYGLSYFFSEFGPNTTTFVMPAELYPVSVRTTGHGISAGVAKLGAFIGVFLFPIFKADFGLRGSMLIAGGASVAGMLLTFVLPEPARRSLEEVSGPIASRGPGPGRESGVGAEADAGRTEVLGAIDGGQGGAGHPLVGQAPTKETTSAGAN